MKVILQDNIEHLGQVGDVISVKDGYARNFLLPRGKGIMATAAAMKRLQEQSKRIAKEKEAALAEATARGEKISAVKISQAVRVSEDGQMYGSVGISDIVKLLAQSGHELEKRQILLPEPIRAIGEFKIPVRLHLDVTVNIQLTVVKEEAEK